MLAKESGITDKDLASLIYDETVKTLSETGIPSETSMMQSIANAKEVQGITREITIFDVADFNFVQKAVKELKDLR